MSLTRAEFETALIDTFYTLAFPPNTREFQRAVLTNSETLIDGYATSYLRALERVAFYLAQWDASANQAARDAVVGSVVSDLGSASVTPDNAYLWPPTSGHFGDVRGPGTLDNVTQTYSALVDGTAVGNTSIFVAPSGKRFIPQIASFTLIQVTGLSIVATCSIGTNPASYNNIMGATLLTGLNTANAMFGVSLTGVISSVSAAEEVFCRVSIASTATVYNFLASVTGFLINA